MHKQPFIHLLHKKLCTTHFTKNIPVLIVKIYIGIKVNI